MDSDEVRVGTGYPVGQLASAFVTALTHEDADTRRRAEERVHRWRSVLAGMADGRLHVGSRTPVAGLPAWVTPQVVRGGFATGEPAAGGPLQPHEVDVASRVGLPADRRALFAYWLTDAGLAELGSLLASGRYRVELPEEAALLVAAWLLQAGDRLGTLTLIDTIAPFADRLRFTPAPATTPVPDPEIVWRETAGQVRTAVEARKPNERVEAMREALMVWNPFTDDLLTLWCETIEDGRIVAHTPDGWLDRGAALLDRYRQLSAAHTRCSKHRRPKENLAIARAALDDVVAGRPLAARQRGLLQHAVDSMLHKRGRPGTAEHTVLRARQARDASRPGNHTLSRLVGARLTALPQDTGIAHVEAVVRPVDADEAATTGIPAGWPVPAPVARVVTRATAGTLEQLIDRGVVASAEVLASLTPQVAAATAAATYPNPALRTLMAATYRAFRNRRSLLLLNLEHQVRLDELPWVQAVAAVRLDNADSRATARRVLARLAGSALHGFPATLLPNPLIRELASLSTQAGLDVPWTEELAADIFMGTFSAKYLQAAKVAAQLLTGSLYARYYDIDYPAVAAIRDTTRRRRRAARTSNAFDTLCHDRAGVSADRFLGNVAANGKVIEQAQILTTHNLATIAHIVKIDPTGGWAELARRSLAVIFRLTGRLQHNPRALRTVKDTAYAWRHTLFYLSFAELSEQSAFVAHTSDEIAAQPPHVRARLAPAVAGLAHVAAGGRFDADGTAGQARRLLGWTTERHWILTQETGDEARSAPTT
jgi:hypothetical protein